MKFVSILVAGLLVCADVGGQEVSLSPGFVSGNAFRDLSAATKNGYVMGLLDGFQFSPWFGGDERRIDKLTECLGRSRSDQWVAVTDQYLAEHPELWHYPAHMLMFRALKEVCPGIG